MSEEQIISVVTDIARKIFIAPDLVYRPELVFQEIRGFNSVLAVEFILAVEGAFNVIINEEQVDEMHTMGFLITILQQKVKILS